jgi:hypothetical protein
MAEGFASGFQQGFGLAEQEYRQNAIDQRAAEAASSERQAMARNKLLAEENKNNSIFRQTQLERQAIADQAEADARKATADYERGQATANSEIRAIQSETERTQTASIAADAEAKRKARDKKRSNTEDASLAQLTLDLIDGVDAGSVSGSAQAISDGFAGTTGTLFDFGVLTDPDTMMTGARFAEQMRELQQGKPIKSGVFLDAANNLLRKSNSIGVGEEIDDTFRYAPQYMKDQGGYRITDKTLIDLKISADGTSVTGTVLVTVNNGKNEQKYTAPMTTKRANERTSPAGGSDFADTYLADGGAVAAPSPSNRSGVEISVQDLIAGYGGYMQLVQHVNSKGPTIRKIRRESQFQDSDGDYDADAFTAAKETKIANYTDMVTKTGRQSSESPIGGMSNDEFLLNTKLVDDWAENQVLFPDSKRRGSDREDYFEYLAEIRNAPAIKKAIGDRVVGDDTILLAQDFMDYNEEGELVLDDKKKPAFYEWQNNIRGRGQDNSQQGGGYIRSGKLYGQSN